MARTYTRVWNLSSPSSWVTNPTAFHANASMLILSNYGFVLWAALISSIRVGCTSTITTLSSSFLKSSYKSPGSANKLLSAI